MKFQNEENNLEHLHIVVIKYEQCLYMGDYISYTFKVKQLPIL